VTPGYWQGRRVLVTGHTGFKGAWLCLWLSQMGARVSGLALAPVGVPNLWSLFGLHDVHSHIGDICDEDVIDTCLTHERPDTVIHLAAQSLVRRSYSDPMATYSTNILGVAKLLNAVRRTDCVRSCIIVTSDKCYQNNESAQVFKETDPMGGRDPYSASKGAAELVTESMRLSFFAPYAANGHSAGVASARAGNVIGGGDWSLDRLVPDIVRGCLGPDQSVIIRSPNSVRPWQHVLEPLRGYLLLAEHLNNKIVGADSGWNFGPETRDVHPVIDVADAVVTALGTGRIEIQQDAADLHEAVLLQIDSTKARNIGWRPVLDFEATVAMTAEWYAEWHAGAGARDICSAQIDHYMDLIG